MILTIDLKSNDTVTLLNAMHKVQDLLKKGIFAGSGHVYDDTNFFVFKLDTQDFVDRYEVRLNGLLTTDDLSLDCEDYEGCRHIIRGNFYTDDNFKAHPKWYSWSVWKNGVDVSREYANWVRAHS